MHKRADSITLGLAARVTTIRKNDPSLSLEQAVDKAVANNADLMEQVRADRKRLRGV